MTVQETQDDDHLSVLSELILKSYASTKAEVQKKLRPYWSFIDEIAITYEITVKCKRIIVPTALQGEALKQLYLSHIGIEKTRLLTHESIY